MFQNVFNAIKSELAKKKKKKMLLFHLEPNILIIFILLQFCSDISGLSVVLIQILSSIDDVGLS